MSPVISLSSRKSTYKHADRVRALLASAPPLTDSQRSDIEGMLRIGMPTTPQRLDAAA